MTKTELWEREDDRRRLFQYGGENSAHTEYQLSWGFSAEEQCRQRFSQSTTLTLIYLPLSVVSFYDMLEMRHPTKQ